MALLAGSSSRAQQAGRGVLLLLVALVAIASLPQIDRGIRDEAFSPRLLRSVDDWAAQIRGRAVVLFRFSSNRRLDEEPVYNVASVWPDDAQIVRAHDRGERNGEIYRYYAQLQSDRAFYLYDE